MAVAAFKRVDLQDSEPPSAPDPVTENLLVCYACNRSHPPGQCRLKSAGVEHCPLCGLAHYGVRRTCPHFQSEVQLSRMLEALKNSTEDREIRNLARSYVGGIKGDLARRRRSLNPNPTPTLTPGDNPAVLGALNDQKKNSIYGTAAPFPAPGGPGPGVSPGVGPGPSPAIDLTGDSGTNNTAMGSMPNGPSWRSTFKTWLNGQG
jgi:chromodomain-helicase-DNA-binding protein 4